MLVSQEFNCLSDVPILLRNYSAKYEIVRIVILHRHLANTPIMEPYHYYQVRYSKRTPSSLFIAFALHSNRDFSFSNIHVVVVVNQKYLNTTLKPTFSHSKISEGSVWMETK